MTADPAPEARPEAPAPHLTRPPGMKDVARVAGVSHQTVSRVLNGHPRVRDETRSRVLAAVEHLGYRPNAAARALVTGRSRTIGIIGQAGVYYGPTAMLAALQAGAHDAGWLVSTETVEAHTEAALAGAVERLSAQAVAGIVLIATSDTPESVLDALREQGPILAVEGAPSAGIGVVGVDQEHGARQATEHLLALGHRTVWHLAGRPGWYETTGRVAGWRAALAAAGADEPPLLRGDWSAESGHAAGQLLARVPDVTAVFAANDQMALGVMCALRERGRQVPDDVSVVGFDDVPEATYYWPPLTTVAQDFAAVAREALARIIAMIEDDEPSVERHLIAPDLVVRRSSAAPPAR